MAIICKTAPNQARIETSTLEESIIKKITNRLAQKSRPQLQVGLAVNRQTKSRMAGYFASQLMELALDDVNSVVLAKIQAVKDLDGAIAFVESVAQDAKRSLVAARLTQVLLIERASSKKIKQYCTCSQCLFCFPERLCFPARRRQVLPKSQDEIEHAQCGKVNQQAQG
jgi:hypothetical protein